MLVGALILDNRVSMPIAIRSVIINKCVNGSLSKFLRFLAFYYISNLCSFKCLRLPRALKLRILFLPEICIQ